MSARKPMRWIKKKGDSFSPRLYRKLTYDDKVLVSVDRDNERKAYYFYGIGLNTLNGAPQELCEEGMKPGLYSTVEIAKGFAKKWAMLKLEGTNPGVLGK